jgi:F0F1-type ATP synthase assembly protein I
MVLGSEMASFTVVGLLVDYALGTMPGFTIGLTLFGFVAAFFQLLRIARRMSEPPGTKPGPS